MPEEFHLPQLGQVSIIEVFEYYNGPILFSCQDVVGGLYLALNADDDGQTETWLYAPMSERRLNMVRSGSIDLHDAFSRCERGWLYKVLSPITGEQEKATVSMVRCDALEDDIFPLPALYLQLPTRTQPELELDVGRQAHQEYRNILRIALSRRDILSSSFPTGPLGEVLTTTSQAILQAAEAVLEPVKDKNGNYIPVAAFAQTQMTASGPGSFVIELSPSMRSDLWRESKADQVFEYFVSLLDAVNNAEDLLVSLRQGAERSARLGKAFYEFLKCAADNTDQMKVTWATPKSMAQRTVVVGSVPAQFAAEYLVQSAKTEIERVEIEGTLNSGNVRTGHFEIEGEDVIAKGYVDDKADSPLVGATLDQEYVAVLLKRTTDSLVRPGTKVDWLLVSLRPVDEL